MLQSIEQFLFRNLTPLSIRHLQPPDVGGATGLAASVYRQLEREFQTVPPVTMHHLDPELMAGVWSACRETLVAGPRRSLKEAVAVAVSTSNRCPYCVQAHTSFLAGSSEAADPALAAWAAATGERGKVAGIVPPFPREIAPAVMGTAVLFHYINRMANIFLDDTMMPIIGKVPLLREPAFQVFSSVVSGRIAALDVPPGEFLTPDPETPLPEAFAWSAPNPHVAGGLRRLRAAAVAASTALDAGARELVERRVSAWEGEAPGIGKSWLEQEVATLPPASRPQARIALLAAIASWAVDERDITEFRQAGGDDRALLDTAAWGSWLAAERIASWL
jgi:AhpD family alkylhydroperoxidase